MKSRDKLEDLFVGLRCCLYANVLSSMSSGVNQSQASNVSDQVVEVILKANQVLFELMSDISAYDELEKWVAQLIPVFIENLGSPKVSSIFGPLTVTGCRKKVNSQMYRHVCQTNQETRGCSGDPCQNGTREPQL